MLRLKQAGELPHWLLPGLWQSLRLVDRGTHGQSDCSAVHALRAIMEQSSAIWPLGTGARTSTIGGGDAEDGAPGAHDVARLTSVPALLPAAQPAGQPGPRRPLAPHDSSRCDAAACSRGARVARGFIAEVLFGCQQWAFRPGIERPSLWRYGAAMTLLRDLGPASRGRRCGATALR